MTVTRREQVVVDPDPRCAGTYVNDAFGPDQTARESASEGGHSGQNVEFVRKDDLAGFPHAFWRVLRPVAPGAQLLGDYGADYWRSAAEGRHAAGLV